MFRFMIVLACFSFIHTAVEARIKLVALPDREATQVRLDHPEATVLQEERILTLQKGANQVDFAWKSVQIWPESIRLTLLQHQNPATVLSVSYPPNEQALIWQLSSASGQQVKVRISYVLGFLDRLVAYKTLVNQNETAMDLMAYLVLRNFSGENLQQADFILDGGNTFSGNVASGETKRLAFFQQAAIPMSKHYEFDARSMPLDPKAEQGNVDIPVYYTFDNTKENGLGQQPLWLGKVRLYGDEGNNSTILLGEDHSPLVPVGQTAKWAVGYTRDIVVTQREMKAAQLNVHYNRNKKIVLFDREHIMVAKVENFKDRPAHVTLIQPMPIEWDMQSSSHEYEVKNNGLANVSLKVPKQLLHFSIEVPKQDAVEVKWHYIARHLQR